VSLPRLHVITSDAVLAAPGFREGALALIGSLGDGVAVHIRGHATPGRALFDHAEALAGPARQRGSTLVVNDRVDVALAVGCGAQVGRRSVPLRVARGLLGTAAPLGYSAHSAAEAHAAVDDGADFIVLGTIWASASHPEVETGGVGRVAEAAAGASAPILAIGGVTPARARDARAAGAYGVAVLSGIWTAPDVVVAATAYLESMGITA
jgi:thiamine-phosphate diphosphorylase